MKRLLLIAILSAQVAGVHAAKQYRDFKDTQGRTIRGCVLAFDSNSGIVTFERDNKRTAKVPLSIFSDEDQQHIRGWKVNQAFLSESYFKISTTRKKEKGKKRFRNNSEVNPEKTSYEVALENRSAMDFEIPKVEYCIYYEQEELTQEGMGLEEGVLYGTLAMGTMQAKSKKELLTNAVTTYKRELRSDRYYIGGANSVQRGKVRGIWIRVHAKLPSGKTLTREYSQPDTLCEKKKWASSSIDVGLN